MKQETSSRRLQDSEGHKCITKVFKESSKFGINGSRYEKRQKKREE